ncbi:TrmH family RNA methyltransferase [Candidatus Saccharibacteria bacterium]|nr:TrmH family RNA methyltransferase [Candidatus Saccharibacteria bacterium]
MQKILIAHNIRSTHNIGSIFRTADGFGVTEIIFSGYSPYPELLQNDPRLPHIRRKLTTQISKTALGAENTVPFSHSPDISQTIKTLKSQKIPTLALEQSPTSINLSDFAPSNSFALILGEEVNGIPLEILKLADHTLEIPMLGSKNSFNVSVATGIALYHLTHITPN